MGGRTIALLESRRAVELADLVRRYGGEPWSIPIMREAPLADQTVAADRLRQLCAEGADAIVCLTGVGVRALFELAAELGLEPQLRTCFERTLVAVRGAKPATALRDLGIRIDRAAAEPFTSRQVLAALAGDGLGRVAVQLYGEQDSDLVGGLRARGAVVLELPVYRYGLPVDAAPAMNFIDNVDRAQALAVTSATQVRNLFALAGERGPYLTQALRSLTLAAVGPVAARSFEERGLTVAVRPEHPHMGAMIRDLAQYFR